ncbi:MAG: dipeptidase [Halioglobus sp.]|nr:dipeptidase [Halioglobus sp.]
MLKKILLGTLALVITAAVLARALLPGAIEESLNTVDEHAPYPVSERARRLHDSLFIVDLHSDSLLWDRDLSERSSRGQVDLPRMRQGNVALQVFSATTKSPAGQNYEHNEAGTDTITPLAIVSGWPTATWGSLYERASYQLEKLRDLVAANAPAVVFVRRKADLERLVSARQADPDIVGAMYLIEGAHPLEGDINNLDRLQAQGLQFVGLTHFFDNELGGSLHGTSGEGLTDFGRKVIARADELGMTIDIAHASPQMVRDVLALTSRPVVLSHGGFRGHCDSARNLDDELMLQVAAAGGIIGVGYWDAAVCDYSPSGIARSIRYGITLMGLQHIALGSDYDGAVTTSLDTSELAALTQAMLDQGFTEAEIRAVMGGNMLRFLRRQLPE